ncbi:MAG: hypothetical protein LBS60_04345 [Deltaproteobacteria bacterium]|nr:hypothetical protein [Deltaproteobacteria bacterium]
MYEFAGETKAKAFEVNLPNAAFKGLSGLVELGLAFKPGPTYPFSLDAGVQGNFGFAGVYPGLWSLNTSSSQSMA